eukprot:616204_1
MASNIRRRRSNLSVAPIECNDGSEQLESTTLFHLYRRQSTRRSVDPYGSVGIASSITQSTVPIYAQPMMSVPVSVPYEMPRVDSGDTSPIYIKPNHSSLETSDLTTPHTNNPYAQITHTPSDYKHKIHCLEGHKATVLCVATCKFQNGNQSKQYIFSGSQDSSIGVWNTNTFEREGILLGHSRSILGLYVMNQNGVSPCLVSTSRDNCICLWDIASLSLLFRITGLPSLVYDIECLSFENDGYYLYGCCQDTNIFVLSLSIVPSLMRLYHDKLKIEHEHKQQMAAFKKKSKKKSARRSSKSPTNETNSTDKDVDCISMLSASDLLLLQKPSILCPTDFNGPVADKKDTYAALHATQPQKQEDVTSLSQMISSIKFELPLFTSEIKKQITSDTTVQFLSKSVNELIDIYYDLVYDEDEETDEAFMIHRVFGGCHRGFIYVMKRIENEYKLITSASDGTCKIWDVSSKYKLKLLSVLTGHTHSVIDCDLMSHRYLVTASRDETVKVWNISDVDKPHTRHTTEGHDSELTAVKVIESMNACVIVCASRSGHVVFRNGVSYDLIATYSVQGVKTDEADVICVMRFAFIEPSWLLLCDTANAVQIWNIKEILQTQLQRTTTTTSYTVDTILTRLGLTEYIRVFQVQKVDYNTLLCLTEHDLNQISIPLGPRKKICSFIQDTKMNRSVFNRNDNLIADLVEFVSFKSISSNTEYESDCWNAAYYIQSISEQCGAETRLVQGNAGKNPVVLAKFASSSCKTTKVEPMRIVMYGHYDVVDIHNPNEWKSPPFELTGRNGYLYGRGAIRELLEEGEHSEAVEIVVIIEGHEEYGWKHGGLTHVVEQSMDWLSAPTLIICSNSYWLGDEVPCLVYGMRGHLQLTVAINGSKHDCHSGVHGGAFTEPMYDLMSIVTKLKQNNVVHVPGFYDQIAAINEDEQALYDAIGSTFDTNAYLKSIGFDKTENTNDGKAILMQKWRNPALSVHNVRQSSNECSVISKTASAVVSIRTVPNQSNIEIIRKCKKYLTTEFNKLSTLNTMGITAKNIGDHWLMDYNHFIFKCAHQAIVQHWQCKPLYIREGGTNPATNYLHTKLNAPIVQFPLGQSTDRAHLENERIRLQNLLKGKDVIKSFLLNLIQHHAQQK